MVPGRPARDVRVGLPAVVPLMDTPRGLSSQHGSVHAPWSPPELSWVECGNHAGHCDGRHCVEVTKKPGGFGSTALAPYAAVAIASEPCRVGRAPQSDPASSTYRMRCAERRPDSACCSSAACWPPWSRSLSPVVATIWLTGVAVVAFAVAARRSRLAGAPAAHGAVAAVVAYVLVLPLLLPFEQARDPLQILLTSSRPSWSEPASAVWPPAGSGSLAPSRCRAGPRGRASHRPATPAPAPAGPRRAAVRAAPPPCPRGTSPCSCAAASARLSPRSCPSR